MDNHTSTFTCLVGFKWKWTITHQHLSVWLIFSLRLMDTHTLTLICLVNHVICKWTTTHQSIHMSGQYCYLQLDITHNIHQSGQSCYLDKDTSTFICLNNHTSYSPSCSILSPANGTISLTLICQANLLTCKWTITHDMHLTVNLSTQNWTIHACMCACPCMQACMH